MVDNYSKSHDNNALVQIGYSGKKSTCQRRLALKAQFSRKANTLITKVLLIPPGQNNSSELWVLVEDETSVTSKNKNNACDKSHKSKYFMPFTAEKLLKGFKDQGYSISHNPCDKRNCQFYAFWYLLQKIIVTGLQGGMSRSSKLCV